MYRISRFDDEKSFKDLFDIYYTKLVEVAKFFVKDQYAAQDVVSEVFVKVWNNRAKLSDVLNVSTYLYVVTKRQSLNYIRNNEKRNHDLIGEKEVNTFVEVRSPEKMILTKEFVEIINAAVKDLPSKCRVVYTMVKDDGMKYKEVADTLNISVKTVEMHIGKALKRIKAAFDNYQK